ncbi:uncharacterized protein LOC141851545 [Brevipalpus obovatus]|uniref:uncharacterized protein LOC141851545 n=1 Tax=Brevipalpus obovatus TaxID=246614 RepID=UPI003D9EC15E
MPRRTTQTTLSSQIQLQTIWSLPKFSKILASGLEDINEESEKELGFYALRICEKSVGLYSSAPPFNASKESMRHYIEQVFHLKNKGKPPTLLVDPSYLPKLKFHLKNAINLPPKTCNQSCSPFIRIRIADKAIKTNKDCVFTSPKLYKELNPVWNCRGSIPISHEDIASKRKIVIELWDAHIPGPCASLRQMIKSRSIDDYVDSWRDLAEFIMSKFSSKTSGDKIAYTSLYLKDIPASEYNVSLEIRDALGHDCSLLKFSLSWGSEITGEDTEVHVTKLKIHIRLIKHLIIWHCRQVVQESISDSGLSTMDTSNLSAIADPKAPKEDELDDILEPIVNNLLNSPAFTLISQHCISLNIHLRENELLLHIVACKLLKAYLDRMDRIPKEKEITISPISYSYLFRVILLSFILSLQVPQKLKGSNDSVFGIFCYGLEDALESLFHSYGLRFGPIIFDMLQKIDSHPFEGVHHLSKGLRREFLLFLRTFDRYSKIFPNANFQERFNVFLCKSICDYLESKLANQPNYVSPALYDNVADTIENFDEILQRNWSCSLSKILGGNGMHRVLTAFATHINPLVSNLIAFWKRDPVKHQETLFDAYLAVMRIDKMFFTMPLRTNPIPSHQELKSRVHPKLENLIDLESIAQQSRFSSRASSMYSIDEFARKTTKLLPVRQDRPPSIITKIELNSYFQFHKTSKSDAGLTNIFPPNIELMWGNLQRTRIKNFIQKLTTDMIFKPPSDLRGVKFASVTACIYRGIFSRTFHFFASFNSWSERSFLLSLSIFLESIEYFADYLSKKPEEMQKSNQPVVGGIETIVLNVLSLLRNRYLRKEFIESLTDAEEYMAWEWFLACLDLDSSFDTRFPLDEKVLLAKAETKRLSTAENFLITLLIKTDMLCHKICYIEDRLMGVLIKNILICTSDKNKKKGAPGEDNRPGVVEKSFDYTLRMTVDSIESMENKKLLLFGLKYNLQRRVEAQNSPLTQSKEVNIQIELDKLQSNKKSSDSENPATNVGGSMVNEQLIEMTDIFVRQLDVPQSLSSSDSTDS